jgi:hypothetical protein
MVRYSRQRSTGTALIRSFFILAATHYERFYKIRAGGCLTPKKPQRSVSTETPHSYQVTNEYLII